MSGGLWLGDDRNRFRSKLIAVVAMGSRDQFRRRQSTLARRQMAAANVFGDNEAKPLLRRHLYRLEPRFHTRLETRAKTITAIEDGIIGCFDNRFTLAVSLYVLHEAVELFAFEQGKDVGQRMKFYGLDVGRTDWRRL